MEPIELIQMTNKTFKRLPTGGDQVKPDDGMGKIGM
jgi:hypothetical protein